MGPPRRKKKGDGSSSKKVEKVISRKKRRKQERTVKKQKRAAYHFKPAQDESSEEPANEAGDRGSQENPSVPARTAGGKGLNPLKGKTVSSQGQPSRPSRNEPLTSKPRRSELSVSKSRPARNEPSTSKPRRSELSVCSTSLQQANRKDKDDIAKFEKLLNIDGKKKSMPNSFRQDGLDCILFQCLDGSCKD